MINVKDNIVNSIWVLVQQPSESQLQKQVLEFSWVEEQIWSYAVNRIIISSDV